MKAWLLVLVVLVGCGGGTTCPVCPAAAPAASNQLGQVAPSPAPTLEGVWRGVLAGKLHLALTITRHGNKLMAVLDSIDQGAKLPVDEVVVEGDTVRFAVPMVSGSYEGKLEGTDLKGTWTQYSVPQPLDLVKGEAAEPPKPSPPPKPLDAPIEVSFSDPIAPLHADDHTVLVYELHLTNTYPAPIALKAVEVTAGGKALARLDGAELAHACAHPGAGPGASDEERLRMAGGGIAVVYMWVTVDGAVPAALDHRVVVQVGDAELAVPAARALVRTHDGPVIASPLRGKGWMAVNGPSNTSRHRRAMITLGGRRYIAQRFAIDWVQLGSDGKTFTGDPLKNASYHAYGQNALAVADGVVVEVKDGIAENVPQAEPAVPITLETIAGNHVLVDLGGGAVALWAHLQPGSLKVKLGDHVKRGQVLGLVGNSGNSSEPHLHFHVTNGPSNLGAEGVPYAFDAFERDGKKRTRELPTEREHVDFL